MPGELSEPVVPSPRWVFGYKNPLWWLVPFIMIVFAIAAVGMISASLVGGSPPLGFVLVWTGILLWNAYWFLFRIGFSVEVDGSTVTWRAPLRRRAVDLGHVDGLGTFWLGFPRLKLARGPSLILMGSGPGWVTFREALRGTTGRESFAPTRLDRFGARWPGSGLFGSGYYQRLVEPGSDRPR